jgi:hypothetical protein
MTEQRCDTPPIATRRKQFVVMPDFSEADRDGGFFAAIVA